MAQALVFVLENHGSWKYFQMFDVSDRYIGDPHGLKKFWNPQGFNWKNVQWNFGLTEKIFDRSTDAQVWRSEYFNTIWKFPEKTFYFSLKSPFSTISSPLKTPSIQ